MRAVLLGVPGGARYSSKGIADRKVDYETI